MAGRSRLRQSISRWANSQTQELNDLVKEHTATTEVPIGQARDRERVRLRGTLRSVTLQPRGGAPSLEAQLDDGTGEVTIIWLGRRRIVGVVPGRSLRVEGCVSVQDGRRVIFNPRYELVP